MKKNSLGKALLIGGSASVLMSLFTPSLLAEEVNSALNAKKKVGDDVEVIQVSGVRSSLESALLEKREALSIVDAISAKDMDALPALDLGEAMQSIPGVQLNTDDSSRNSTITLRGLPGGYAKVIAEGQSFATPSRSMGVVGSANPFGAFEAGVFDGVTVVKAPTADLQEGGMAGVINKKLQRALGSKDGKYSIGLSSRYEELTDEWNKQFTLSATKHLIKDKLAIAFKVAGSEQNFRVDTANFTQYTSLNTVEDHATQYTGFISPEKLEAYKAEYGITDPLSIVKVIGKAAQTSMNNRGDRISGSANIEWKPIDSLKIGANFLYTKRDLGESNLEDVQFSIGRNDDSGRLDTQTVTPMGAPIRLTDNQNPDYVEGVHDPDLATIPVYAVSHAKMSNVSWSPSNRLTASQEEAKGVFLYANYDTDDWKIDATFSKSNATNAFSQSGIDLRHSNKTNKTYKDLDDGRTYYYAATGLNGEINTGQGDMSKAFATLENFDNFNYTDVNGLLQETELDKDGNVVPKYDLGEDAWKRFENGWKTVQLTAFGSTLDPKINPYNVADYAQVGGQAYIDTVLADDKLIGGKSIDFYVNGRVQRPERDMESGEFNFERYVDIGGDAFRLTSVKSGIRHSREILETYDKRVGGSAMNLTHITSDDFYADGLTSDSQAEFFNGDYRGHYGTGTGWKNINAAGLKEIIQTDMVAYDSDGNVVEEFEIADPTGFAVKLKSFEESDPVNEFFRFNFSADQVINAVYLMGKFEGDIAGFTYRGNAGVRYVETTNDVIGQGFNADGNAIRVLTENDYDNTLPSINLDIDLHDDVVLRAAYSVALVRPNLMSQTPSPTNTNTTTRVQIENSKAEVLPYTADNFDLSLAWYNREGSSISAGFFYKEIDGKIDTQRICPVGDHERFNVGELELIQDGSTYGTCQEIGEYDPGNGEDIVSNRTVIINQTYNSDIPVKVFGYELSMQQNLDFLPYPFDGFGGKLNFTKIDLDEGEGAPMTRIAPHTANFIGYYENDGVSVRLTYNWQDEKLLSAGGSTSFLGSDARTQTAGGRLDLSGGYRFSGSLKGLRLNLKAMNINNRQEYEFIGGNDKAISRIRYQGRIYSVGLSYNF